MICHGLELSTASTARTWSSQLPAGSENVALLAVVLLALDGVPSGRDRVRYW